MSQERWAPKFSLEFLAEQNFLQPVFTFPWKKTDTSFSPQSEPESQLTEHMEKLTVTSMVLSNVPHAHVRF